MGEAEERYWQAIESDQDDDHKRTSDAALLWSDRFEFMVREVEKQASLLRLCQDARDEAVRELFDPPRPGYAKRIREFCDLWPKQVLSHEKLLQYSIGEIELMQIWKPRFKEERSDIQNDD